MKKTLLIFFLLFPLLAFAQDYHALKLRADSLRYHKNFKEAVIDYDKCIDMVLTGKQQLYDSEWINLLGSAMDANKDYPVKYSAMRYGTRAEKISDKIITLKDMGVKYIFSFYSFTGGSTQGYYSNWPYECNPGDTPTNILVWAINNNVFMQAFNACDTYKPFKLNDPELYNLLKAHTGDLIKEEIKRMILKGHDGYSVYYFKFYTDNSTVQKAPMSMQDFRPMEQNQEPIVLKIIKKETIEKGNDIYHSNIKTHLAQLFLRTIEDEKKYYKAINSGAERARVGKLE